MKRHNVDYEPIDSANLETDPSRYRRQFLIALRKSTPEVLELLRDDVFPLYTSPALFSAASAKLGFLRRPMTAPEVTAAELAAFKSSLDGWEKQFNLGDQWLREVAAVTLDLWKSTQADLDALNWADLPFKPAPLPLDHWELEFRNPGWSVESETWEQFAARIEGAFKQRLREYEAAIRKEVSGLGFRTPPEIKKPEHYEWLALYQVRGLSLSAIADRLSTDERTLIDNTVWKAVKKSAGLIGLTLRKPQKGHGPKPRRAAPRRRQRL